MLIIVQMELYLDSSDAKKNLDALLLITCGILALSKIIRFRIQPDGLVSNFVSAVKDYNELKDQEKRVIMRRHAYMGRLVSASVIFSSCIGSTLYLAIPMLSGDEEKDIVNVTKGSIMDYPIPSEYVMALIQLPDNLFFMVFIIEYLMLLFTSTGNLGNESPCPMNHPLYLPRITQESSLFSLKYELGSDTLFFGIIFHLCGQVEILRLEFNRLGNKNERTMESFIVLIKRHIYLLNLAHILNETISSILVMQLFSSCVLICTTGFQLILDLSIGNIVMTMKGFIVLNAMLVQLFAYSYVGDYLTRQMKGISDSIYFCNWYDISKSMAKDLIYVIMRAQYPVFLKAGNFFIVNMETYMSILKTSMSYLSVLRVMVNRRRIISRFSFSRMKESSRKDFAYAMTPMKIVSWPVGTWPLQNYGIFSAMRGIIVISLVLLMLAILQMEMYLDSGDAGKNVDALILITSGVVALSKIIWFRIRPAGLISNFTSAVKDYEELEGQDKRLIVRKHAYIGRVASATVIFSSYIGSTLYMTIPMLAANEEKDIVNVTEESTTDYPIPSEYVMDVIQLPDNLYFMVFIIEYLMLLFTSTGNLGSDSLLFGIIFHLCGQVEILKLEFNKLGNENERIMERFVVLIKRHVYLLNLAKMLNETISSVLVVQLFTSCILICTTGFQFILDLSVGNIVMAMKTLIVMSCLLVQLFAYSYVGEYLKRQMESVGDSVYFCSWYHIPKNVAKGIVFVIMKSQDPVSLKAGKFFIVNMETYMNILKTSMSYLSVLRVMVNP
ncbi:uncharacterized protein LOC117166374 [Bombus vancouverensis nearcticus]|uniref:uncharacterized protein LOC117166374 n=1 Tax=Bombus vancouverensis nearcticus TaxID=2705178 RepID=UPI00402B3F7D